MTNEQLDRACAEAMGWKYQANAWWQPEGRIGGHLPKFSTTIAAAWTLVQHAHLSILNVGGDYWVVGDRNGSDGRVVNQLASARGKDAAPLAIARAFLAAKGLLHV